MLQLSKKVEYALLALRYMAAGSRGQIFTTKEIAEKNQLPYELLAKVMQKLVRKGFIQSYQGVHGGYILAREASEIKIAAVINALEEKQQVNIVQCGPGQEEDCTIRSTCTIKNPLMKLQDNINKVFEGLSILEMV